MATAALGTRAESGLETALLLRVSDPRQAGADRFSVDAQRRVLRERCAREGLIIVREYIGEGESAFTSDIRKRKTILDMSADAEAGVFKNLGVHDLSRYARDEELGHAVFNMLERHGIRLINASSDVDYRTPEGRMMLSIDLGLGSYWSRKMSFHIKKSKRQRYEIGLHNGDAPFGYTSGQSTRDPLVPVPHEAEAIREAFRDYIAGAGYTEIARRWNATGFVPHSKQGKAIFTASAVQSVIENDFYAGFVGYKDERKRGIHQPIISEDLFLAAQAKVRRHPSHAREPWTLSGAICSECGGPIWQSKSGVANDKLYYREASHMQQRPCSVAGRSWRKELADAEVDAVIHEMIADPGWLAEIDREARRLPETDEDGRRGELLEDLRRVNNAYFGKKLDDNEWRLRTDAIQAQLARLPIRPTSLVFAGERLLSIGQVWDGMTTPERREACRILFEEIRMNTREKRLWFRPWPEFQSLFDHRRELCRNGTPDRTRTHITYIDSRWFAPAELILRAS